MNNIINNFDNIFQFARSYGLSLGKKRAIIREFLQTKIIDSIYKEKNSSRLYFIGGTSLRLLRGLDRFSEDLDFNIETISREAIDKLMKNLHKGFRKENITVQLYRNETKKRIYYELRFPELLYQLKISAFREEKITIEFDFERPRQKQIREIILFNRYGFVTNVVSVTLNQILNQKLSAYLNRYQTQPRDIYDIIWLVSQKAKANRNLLDKAKRKYISERKKIKIFKQRLKPFLINEKDVEKLDFFLKIVGSTT